jgi:hypothetical protein
MLSQQLAGEGLFVEQHSEIECENETLISSLASTYGSLSSSTNMPSVRERTHGKAGRLPTVHSENGLCSSELHQNDVEEEDEDDEEEEIDQDEDISTDENSDGDESEISYDDTSDEEEALQGKEKRRCGAALKCEFIEPLVSPTLKLYRLVRDAIILITNTDDVWDSPAYDNRQRRNRSGSVQSYSSCSTLQQRQDLARRMHDVPSLNGEPRVSLRHKFAVLFWFMVLALFYALERCSFKIMIDRMGPFRMVLGGEVVVALHAAITGTFMTLRWLCKKSRRITGMLPLPDIGLMAILDTIQLLLVVISGSHVPPTLTAIIVHVTIPMTTYINHLTGPRGLFYGVFSSTKASRQGSDGQQQERVPEQNEEKSQSSQLLFGATLIMLSSILAITPAILTLTYPNLIKQTDVMADRSAWNTLLYFISYIPGAISQTYKERTLAAYAQPVDPDLLNTLLSFLSAIFAFLVSPMLYPLQGFADLPSTPDTKVDFQPKNWIQQYPSRDVSKNFREGLQCFLGTLSADVQIRGYPEHAHCDFAYGIVFLHVFSIITISYAVGKICNAGAFKIMHKGISAGIILSVVALFFYQVFVDDVEYGVFPSVFHITCAFILVMGSEVYHRVTLQTPSFETEYPPVREIYEDEQ